MVTRRLRSWWHRRRTGHDPVWGVDPISVALYCEVCDVAGSRWLDIAPPSSDISRGVLEQATIAVVGPWFDESYEAGRLAPMELAQRILREYDRRMADEAA